MMSPSHAGLLTIALLTGGCLHGNQVDTAIDCTDWAQREAASIATCACVAGDARAECVSAPRGDTGLENFGVRGSGTIAYTSGEVTSFSGETELFDEVNATGPLGSAGDLLCQYIYPASGVPFATTQVGFDSTNAPVDVPCEGCTFGFDIQHGTPTTTSAGTNDGAFCDILYDTAALDTGFSAYELAFNPAWIDPVDDTPHSVFLFFYDGAGTETDPMTGEELPATWTPMGDATLTGDCSATPDACTAEWSWDYAIGSYQLFELAYYQ